jgi:hypothetical protein
MKLMRRDGALDHHGRRQGVHDMIGGVVSRPINQSDGSRGEFYMPGLFSSATAVDTEGGLFLRTQDLAKIGLLAARGFGGQRLLMFPDEDLIVASTAWHILKDASIEFDVVRRILPGVHPYQCNAHQ